MAILLYILAVFDPPLLPCICMGIATSCRRWNWRCLPCVSQTAHVGIGVACLVCSLRRVLEQFLFSFEPAVALLSLFRQLAAFSMLSCVCTCTRGIGAFATFLNVACLMIYCMFIHTFRNNEQRIICLASQGLAFVCWALCCMLRLMFTCSTATGIAYSCLCIASSSVVFYMEQLNTMFPCM